MFKVGRGGPKTQMKEAGIELEGQALSVSAARHSWKGTLFLSPQHSVLRGFGCLSGTHMAFVVAAQCSLHIDTSYPAPPLCSRSMCKALCWSGKSHRTLKVPKLMEWGKKLAVRLCSRKRALNTRPWVPPPPSPPALP